MVIIRRVSQMKSVAKWSDLLLCSGHERGGLGPGLVLEVDVETLVGQFARRDLGHRPLRLQGPQDPEIVLGVLEIVLGQNPVARRGRVAGQLLIAFIDGLGVAPDLDVLRPLRVPRTVRIGSIRIAAARFPVAAALALHALEISHRTSVLVGLRASARGQGRCSWSGHRSRSLGSDPLWRCDRKTVVARRGPPEAFGPSRSSRPRVADP